MWIATVFAKGFNNERAKFESNEVDPIDVTDKATNFLADNGEYMVLDRSDIGDNYWEYTVRNISTRDKRGGVTVEWVD